MLRIYDCLTEQHELGLVLLAGLICFFASFTVISLVERAHASERWTRLVAFAAAAVVMGSGTWATHFVAMLAFRPGMPVGYDLHYTIISVIIAVVISGLGFVLTSKKQFAAIGGALVGVAVGAMHYTGMSALQIAAVKNWDMLYVLISIASGVALSAFALGYMRAHPTLSGRFKSSILLVLAIVSLHFVGMAALSFTPDPTIVVSNQQTIPSEWIALAVAGTAILLAGIALAGSIVDQRLIEAQRAIEADKAKGQFLARMSHEIRTPMNGVMGMAELLMSTDLTPRQQRFAESIQSSAETLLQVINDILDFSKIEAGKMEIEAIDFDVRNVVDDILVLLAPMAARKDVEIGNDIDASVPYHVIGDPTRLRQVLTNLIGNALKFTENGEVIVTARRETANDHDLRLRFEVRDSGIGIPAEVCANLFHPFSQGHKSTTRKYGGTGLGLAISKLLTEKMGGEIGVESQPGKGSTFWFTINVGRSSVVAEQEDVPAFLKGKRALLADDNETNRHILTDQIERLGMQSVVANDGVQAVEIYGQALSHNQDFDLLIFDSRMPGMRGFEALQAIRAHREAPHIPCIILSSSGERDDEGGASVENVIWSTKPLRYRQLKQQICALLSGPLKLVVTNDIAEEEIKPLHGRILLAEDNLVNQAVAEEILSSLGCQCTMVGNGLEAVAASETGQFDLILMDIEMPEMDGLEATRTIRGREDLAGKRTSIPIIALTARTFDGGRELCLKAGMTDFLNKPFKRMQLYETLQKWLPERHDTLQSREKARPIMNQDDITLPNDVVVLDETALDNIRKLQRPGQPSIMAKIVNLYLQSTPPILIEIRRAADAGDNIAVSKAAHSLKSASSNVGATALAALCKILEDASRTAMPANIDTLVSAIEEAYAHVTPVLGEKSQQVA